MSAEAWAPTCQSRPGQSLATPSAGQPSTGPIQDPWPQQLLGTRRLAGLADGAGIAIAVLDSGVDPDHPQLAGAVAAGFDALDNPGDGKIDCVGHGTGVASIIAARPLGGTGFQGLAPKSTILPIRVSEQLELDGTATGRTTSSAAFANAIRRAVDLRAKVLNLSLTSYRDDKAVHDAIDYALAHDVVVVAAAGNRFDAGNPVPYPAAYDGVIGVGAIGQDGHRLAASQVGPYVDLVAPGDQVVTAALPRGLTLQDGTSFATPFVSATAALVRQYHPELTAAQVTARLTATADQAPGSPRSQEYGAGIVNPYRALTDQIAAPAAPPPAQPSPPVASRHPEPAPARARALILAGGGVVLAALALLVAAIAPRGRRRHWQPGRLELPDPPDPTKFDPAAPAFGDPPPRRRRPQS